MYIPTPIDKPASVQEWAALEAAEVLIISWEDALENGSEPKHLVADLDEVIGILSAWKPIALIRLTEAKLKMEVADG